MKLLAIFIPASCPCHDVCLFYAEKVCVCAFDEINVPYRSQFATGNRATRLVVLCKIRFLGRLRVVVFRWGARRMGRGFSEMESQVKCYNESRYEMERACFPHNETRLFDLEIKASTSTVEDKEELTEVGEMFETCLPASNYFAAKNIISA